MRNLMFVIVVAMVGSVLSIAVIKPYSSNINANHTDQRRTIQ
jgi:hypothetical protein